MTVVYHASPNTNLQVIDPQYNNEGKVFAALQLDMAHAFLGRAGRGFVMGQRRENNIPVFTELLSGAFEFRYRNVPGAIYHLDSRNFRPMEWREQVVSVHAEIPLYAPTIIDDVREQLEKREQAGQINIIRWRGRTDDQAVLDHWLGYANNPRYYRPSVIVHAREFLQDMRPHLLNEFEQQLLWTQSGMNE